MSDTTHRWAVVPHAFPVVPVPAPPAETPPPPDPVPLTVVSDRAPARPAVAPPVLFPGFEILAELGRGGMGVVYKARQRNLNRMVALKVILGGPLASAEDKARFRIEAEAAARLHHANIVQVYDVGEHAGFSYIALELVEGETLRQWQNGRPVEPKVAARLVSATARAIQHAHEQGIIHRDLKPANILLAPVPNAHPDSATAVTASLLAPAAPSRTNRTMSATPPVPLTVSPKVTDFGLAKALDGGTDITRTGVACGTPNYMAPEQVRGKALGTGVDVYGLGAVLYELLTGRPPFVGSDASEVMNLILRADPPGVRRFAPGVPRDLAVIVAKCLEKNPSQRYPSARDAADDLDRFLAGKPIAARPVGSAERAVRWARRNPVVAAFLFSTTFGCVLTACLAVALARTASDERAARSDAEAAACGLQAALTDAEAARSLAEQAREASGEAREAAKLEAQRAGQKQAEADAARARAEDNLRVARNVIRGSMRELSNHPGFAQEEFRGAREKLLTQVREFRDTVAAHAPNTPEWLDDIADVSHFLGYLEFLNQNHAGSVAEYRTAAAAAARWAGLEPLDLKPRVRQSYSLLNVGNALLNLGKPRDAETVYLDATRLIDGVVAISVTNKDHLFQAAETYERLVNVYRVTNNPTACEAAARREWDHARRLAVECGELPKSVRRAAAARQRLADALVKQRKWAEADGHFVDLVATRARVREVCPGDLACLGEYIDAVLAQAEIQFTRGQSERAGGTLQAAARALEAAQAADPSADGPALELATACSRFGEFHHQRKQFPESERRFDQALALTAEVLKRSPSSATARALAARAATSRAHLLNSTGRHREAAAEWARLSVEDPNAEACHQHALFVQQSFLHAGDWRAAVAAAAARMKLDQPAWMWLESAHAMCRAVKQVEREEALAPADRLREVEKAVALAVACLERSRAQGMFATPERVNWFAANPDFAPVRGKFDPSKK